MCEFTYTYMCACAYVREFRREKKKVKFSSMCKCEMKTLVAYLRRKDIATAVEIYGVLIKK